MACEQSLLLVLMISALALPSSTPAPTPAPTPITNASVTTAPAPAPPALRALQGCSTCKDYIDPEMYKRSDPRDPMAAVGSKSWLSSQTRRCGRDYSDIDADYCREATMPFRPGYDVCHEALGCPDSEVIFNTAEDVWKYTKYDLIVECVSFVSEILNVYYKRDGADPRLGICFSYIHAICFMLDIIFQGNVMHLGFSPAEEISKKLVDAKCTNEEGAYILNGFGNDMKHIRRLSIFDIFVTVVGLAGAITQLFFECSAKKQGIASTGDGATLAGLLTLCASLVSLIVCIVEFSAFAEAARDDALLLEFALYHSATGCWSPDWYQDENRICWCGMVCSDTPRGTECVR